MLGPAPSTWDTVAYQKWPLHLSSLSKRTRQALTRDDWSKRDPKERKEHSGNVSQGSNLR